MQQTTGLARPALVAAVVVAVLVVLAVVGQVSSAPPATATDLVSAGPAASAPLAPPPNAPSAREGNCAVWTGTELVIWGGWNGTAALNDGARFNVSAKSWTPMTQTGAPAARRDAAAIWTETEVFVWGGTDTNSANLNDGGLYNPDTDTWRPVTSTGAPTGGARYWAFWDKDEHKVIVWGGDDLSGGIYDPTADQWTAITTTNAPVLTSTPTVVWTGDELFVWGDGQGWRYAADYDWWQEMTTTGAPPSHRDHVAVWTDVGMIVWGGENESGTLTNQGAYYLSWTTPDSWSPITTTNAPSPRRSASAVWTGEKMIVWGGRDAAGNLLNDGGIFDPEQNTWTPLSTAGAPVTTAPPSVVWAGDRMLIWGGYTAADRQYFPTTNAWQPLVPGNYKVYIPYVSRNHIPPFTDDFSDPSSGWLTRSDDAATVTYDSGELKVTANITGWVIPVLNPNVWTAGDFVLEVDARATSSTIGSLGLFFDLGPNGNYLFEIIPRYWHEYHLVKYFDSGFEEIIPWISAPHINEDNETNHLKVERAGNTIKLWLNGYYLTEFDGSDLPAGYAGLAVAGYTGPYDVRFDNFYLYNGNPASTRAASVGEPPIQSVAPFEAAIPTLPRTPQ